MSKIEYNHTCLACGNKNLSLALDLGIQPLANSYLNLKDEIEDRYPLAVNLCINCYHLQLTHTVDPKIIYKNYLYVSGTSKTLKDYSDWFAQLNIFVNNGNPSYLQIYDSITSSNTGLYLVNGVIAGGNTYSIFVDTSMLKTYKF